MNQREAVEQARFIKWTHLQQVRALFPALRWIFHVPNGGKRDGFTGAQMKAMGVKPGVPDLLLPVRSAPYVGLAIEMKDGDKGATSEAQCEWLAHLREEGWYVTVARSAVEAKNAAILYLGGDPGDTRIPSLP